MTPYYDRAGIRLYLGDCREVLREFNKPSNDCPPDVDLLLTDPPYAISLAGVSHSRQPGRGTRKLDFFKGDDDWKATIAMWEHALHEATQRLKPTASVYAWVGHREFGPTVAHLEADKFETRFCVWVKACPAPPPPGSGWPSGAELCVYGYRKGSRVWTHTGVNPPPCNVFVCDSFRFGQPGKEDHPTQKPLGVLAPLLEASSRPGDLVLDPFAGSGSTLVAALKMQRRAIGIELEEKYCEIAAKRLDRELAQGDLFVKRNSDNRETEVRA